MPLLLCEHTTSSAISPVAPQKCQAATRRRPQLRIGTGGSSAGECGGPRATVYLTAQTAFSSRLDVRYWCGLGTEDALMSGLNRLMVAQADPVPVAASRTRSRSHLSPCPCRTIPMTTRTNITRSHDTGRGSAIQAWGQQQAAQRGGRNPGGGCLRRYTICAAFGNRAGNSTGRAASARRRHVQEASRPPDVLDVFPIPCSADGLAGRHIGRRTGRTAVDVHIIHGQLPQVHDPGDLQRYFPTGRAERPTFESCPQSGGRTP